jgi:SAM-dependent methyltransferase
MLHIAPEQCLLGRFGQVPNLDYLTADLQGSRAMVQMDITNIQYPEATFDVIYCSHVLEHVPEDRKAVRQMYRVLKPGGYAVIMVPIRSGPTLEDPSVTDPNERARLYAQHDHVRAYGDDITDRFEEAGFTVTRLQPTDFLDAESIARFVPKGVIFACAKQ